MGLAELGVAPPSVPGWGALDGGPAGPALPYSPPGGITIPAIGGRARVEAGGPGRGGGVQPPPPEAGRNARGQPQGPAPGGARAPVDRGRAGRVQRVAPARVRGTVPEPPQREALGRDGGRMQTPAELGWRTVALGVVAPGAGGYDVLPRVPTAPAAWQHVVYGLRRSLAVRAPAAVPGEDRPAGQAHVGPVRHPDVPGEPDHQRDGQRLTGAVQDPVAVGDAHGLAGQDENGGAAHRHDTQRLVRLVEHPTGRAGWASYFRHPGHLPGRHGRLRAPIVPDRSPDCTYKYASPAVKVR